MQTDVCIIGGGLVGLAAALAFSHQGHRVRLLESMSLQADEPAIMDARSLALSHSSMQILHSLGLWQSLRNRVAAIQHIHVSSAGHFGVTRLAASDLEVDAMGYVVEYHVLIQVLLDSVNQDSRIEIIAPARFVSLQQSDNSVSVTYRFESSEQSLDTSLLIVADGAQSAVREFLDIPVRVTDFGQSAIIANVSIKKPSQAVAYERFTAQGPLAMLPLTDQRYALVWTNSPQRTEQLMQSTDEDFLAELYASFGYRLGYFDDVGERGRFVLKLTRAQQLVAGRCILLGNAANTLHPVAGQGLNLALRDIAAIYDLVSEEDLTSARLAETLQAYPKLRNKDQGQAVGLSSLLVQLFSNDLPVFNHARAGALAALDLCPLLKREFSWAGMGYGTSAYSLMRGMP